MSIHDESVRCAQHALRPVHDGDNTARRCLALVERCAPKFMREGGGALSQEMPQAAPHRRRGPKRKEGA